MWRIIPWWALAALVLFSCPAFAELGGSTASIETDRVQLGARASVRAMGRYDRHELTRPNGGSVHELTNAQGQVFAVTWSGPGKPDLRRLLGRRFAALQTPPGAAGRGMRALRRPVSVATNDLSIQAEGHMGWFHGAALVPSLAPAGFALSDLASQP